LFWLPAKVKVAVQLDLHPSVTATFSSSNDLQDSLSRESFIEWFLRKLTRRDQVLKRQPRSNLADPSTKAYDTTETLTWHQRSADKGDAWVQLRLGHAYQQGNGVEQNDVEALKWYRLAAEQGDAIGQYNLADSYLKGHGVAQDCLKAHLWFSRSAEGGDQQAVESRDRLAAKMTVSQMNEVQEMANSCVSTDQLSLQQIDVTLHRVSE
jgi:TPR repeat protein